MTGLTGLQIISTHRLWALSRKLLIGWLAISGVFPASVQAEIWNRAAASGMNDVAVAPDGAFVLIWRDANARGCGLTQRRSTDGGQTWDEENSHTKHRLERIYFRNGRGWAIGFGGTILSNGLGENPQGQERPTMIPRS